VHADAVLDPFAEPAPDQRRIAPGTRAWRRLGRRKASPQSQPHPYYQPGEHAAATEKRLDKRWVFHFHLPQR
jgi:hypothetical protein